MTLNKLIQSAEGRDLFTILYCTEALRMSVISNLASLTSSIKGDHVYRSGARVYSIIVESVSITNVCFLID